MYISGTHSSAAAIRFNTFDSNVYGIHTDNNAGPVMAFNNFINNSSYGLYNTSPLTLAAENNWWGDVQGPDASGDATYGNVDADPWLTRESTAAGGVNAAPIAVADAMTTGAACRTFNVLQSEDRRVTAALIAVE